MECSTVLANYNDLFCNHIIATSIAKPQHMFTKSFFTFLRIINCSS